MVASALKMILEKRNHKVRITAAKLREIIIEEYIKEEGIDESQAAEDLLRQILGDEEYARRRAAENPNTRGGDTAPMKKSNKAEPTMALDTGSAEGNVADQIAKLVQGMDPDDVAQLFQVVFSKLPGVEMQDDEPPQTLYTPGAEGRPQMGFRLEELKAMIREILANRNNV